MAYTAQGNFIDQIGTTLGLPEFGLSEKLAGGNTVNTGVYKPYYDNNGGYVGNAPYQSSIPLGPVTNTGALYSNVSKTPSNVLGASTSSGGGGGQPSTRPSGSGYAPGQGKYAGWDPAAEAADRAAKGDFADYGNTGGGGFDGLRNEISSGWDSYINSLNDQLGGLQTQQQNQEGIANSQYTQGLNTLGLQKNEGLTQLGSERERVNQEQAKTLRDLSGNLRNSFMAGNIYLGARGAGDSSAANQYALALTKEGSRQRSDVMQQGSNNMMEIGRREETLNKTYNTEVKNLEESKNQKIFEISNWFQQAQQQVKQAQAQGQLQKGQDLQSVSRSILDRALSAMDQINQEVSSRKQALDSWAISNSKDIQSLKANLQNVSQFTANMPQAQAIAGTPQVGSDGSLRVQTGYGSGQKRDLYGNLI
jgi:hypothetical protein